MSLDAALTALAQSFRITMENANPTSHRFSARLIPPGNGRLSVNELVTTVEVVTAPVNLTWLTKDVRFTTPEILDTAILGGMPINGLLALSVGGVTNGATNPPGVAGVLGGLSGTLPIPIETSSEVSRAVEIDVRWELTDREGNVVSGVAWTVGDLSGTGAPMRALPEQALEPLELLIDPLFIELTGTPAFTQRLTLAASIRLEAAGVTTPFIPLPPLPIDVPAIPVPTVAVLCRHKDFAGTKLLLVPGSSPVDASTVGAAFSTLNTTLEPLRDTFAVVSFLVEQAAVVADLLSSGTIRFRKSNQLGDLNDVDLESGTLNDTEAEDQLSSMALLGVPRRQLECFNASNFGTSEGQLTITAGPGLIALVRDLHSAAPVSEPAGRVSVPFAPGGSTWFFDDVTGFGDEFSSIRFAFGA